ncbi:MAG: hypothetical protein ACRDTR_23725 [Rubrobacter sp.]
MKRATVTLPDELEQALEAYRRAQDVPPALTAITQTALREYLERRGFFSSRPFRPFSITPVEEDSGASDVSTNHDKYFVESIEQ